MPTRITLALDALRNLDQQLWYDLGSHLTCHEANVFFEFLCAIDKDEEAEALMSAHADDDQEGDEHYATDYSPYPKDIL